VQVVRRGVFASVGALFHAKRISDQILQVGPVCAIRAHGALLPKARLHALKEPDNAVYHGHVTRILQQHAEASNVICYPLSNALV
jgi:hypothetical protein